MKLLCVCLAVIGLLLGACGYGYAQQYEKATVCFPRACVEVEIADTRAKQSQGLMYRRTLPENGGMLFIYERPQRQIFWMKNMQFSLDMLWISDKNEVLEIRHEVPPCYRNDCPEFVPKYGALYVLEVNAGFCDAYGISPGEFVDIYLPGEDIEAPSE